MATEEKKREVHESLVTYKPIGIVHSGHTVQEDTPIQGIFNDSKGTVEVFEEYAEGLIDIEKFTHLILLYHFDRSTGSEIIRKPFLDEEKDRGIFSIRHFNRPNPIGFSIVSLYSVKGNILEIGAVDILDGTPVIDIKPYVYQFDHREEVKSGWVDNTHVDEIAGWNATPKGLRNTERTNL